MNSLMLKKGKSKKSFYTKKEINNNAIKDI